jgi:hypothetical protein
MSTKPVAVSTKRKAKPKVPLSASGKEVNTKERSNNIYVKGFAARGAGRRGAMVGFIEEILVKYSAIIVMRVKDRGDSGRFS